jgi:hypothetical protein
LLILLHRPVEALLLRLLASRGNLKLYSSFIQALFKSKSSLEFLYGNIFKPLNFPENAGATLENARHSGDAPVSHLCVSNFKIFDSINHGCRFKSLLGAERFYIW